MSETTGITANLLFEDPCEPLLYAAQEAEEARLAHGPSAGATREQGGWTFPQGWRVDDESDPQSGTILLHWLSADGLAAIVSAADLDGDEEGANELERRITRDLTEDFTIDDWGASAKAAPAPVSLSTDEASALLEVLSDSEMYVDDGEGGWVRPETYRTALAPLVARLRASVPPAPAPEPRTILVHLNVELPHDAPCSAEDVAREVEAALEVGTDPEHTPALAIASVCVPLVDEV